jgi:hypothetical protein
MAFRTRCPHVEIISIGRVAKGFRFTHLFPQPFVSQTELTVTHDDRDLIVATSIAFDKLL